MSRIEVLKVMINNKSNKEWFRIKELAKGIGKTYCTTSVYVKDLDEANLIERTRNFKKGLFFKVVEEHNNAETLDLLNKLTIKRIMKRNNND